MSSSSPSRNHQRRTVTSSNHPGSANTSDDTFRHTSHPTLLEPPFSYADRPSSPRHHSTSSPSNTRSTARPRHSAVPSTVPATPPHHDSAPAIWPDDDITLPRLRPDDIADLFGWATDELTGFHSSDGHHSLSDFANQDFSSPSTYPSFTSGSHGPLPDVDASSHNFVHSRPANTRNGSGRPPRTTSGSLSASTSSTNSSTTHQQPSFAADASQSSASSSLHRTDNLNPSLSSENMPPTTRRQSMVGRSNAVGGDGHANKRQRTTERGRAPKENGSHARIKTVSSDNPFDEANDEDTSSAKREDEEAPLVVDLTDPTTATENLEASPEPKEDTRVKLSAFQCVICMDNVTTLTVTHCGHLFCAQCLHSSLNVDTLNKGKCPMCRTKIDMKARESYGPKTKGTWPLELKLMTSNRKGKRKAGALS